MSSCTFSFALKNSRTSLPATVHDPSCNQVPPLAMCLKRAISAILNPMSRLGACRLLRTEHNLNTPLKLSNVSVDNPIVGPKRRTSLTM